MLYPQTSITVDSRQEEEGREEAIRGIDLDYFLETLADILLAILRETYIFFVWEHYPSEQNKAFG